MAVFSKSAKSTCFHKDPRTSLNIYGLIMQRRQTPRILSVLPVPIKVVQQLRPILP